jgi:ATP-dependent helicase/nuclease subunit B
MQSFLSKVVNQVLSTNNNISDVTLILPSKRSVLFLKKELKKQIKTTILLPKVLSIEEFIIQISEFDLIDNITLIFEFYKIYSDLTPVEKLDSFETFTKWASILLQDFNEIDSNLIDAQYILNYVTESKRIEKWNLDEKDHTQLTQNYLNFFDQIKIYYSKLFSHLKNKNIGYQGMLYRKAYENTNKFITLHSNQKFVFAGFNALNKAEENIIHEFLLNDIADIYWDNDDFYSISNNQAGKYFKLYKDNWNYYNSHSFKWIDNNIDKNKNVFIYGAPQNISQIKKVGAILSDLSKNNSLKNSAVILGNEKLLPILLNSIPKEIKEVNITMGYELQNIPLANFFEFIFKLHLNKNKFESKNSFYYKDFINVIKHSILYNYWSKDEAFNSKLHTLIYKKKTIFISPIEINELVHEGLKLTEIFNILFGNWGNNINTILKNFVFIINYLGKSKNLNTIEKEYLFRFNNVFQQLLNLNNDYGFINNLNTLHQLYKQILRKENLSFQGEPLKGLQIMGVLESRVLDFDNVIITSVNEGFLPMGGSQNSFIPFDIKIETDMPTYKEKDTIFAYHFYRLFHRAKNIYLLYNTETDDFGSGEQSRFITQLLFAKENKYLENVTIKKNLVMPSIHSSPFFLKEVQKSDEVIDLLKKIALEGFSPSSLNLYIRNPIDFYTRKVLKLKEYKEVEETVAANTFGTIIHDTLENLYSPFIGNYLTLRNIEKIKEKLEDEIIFQFKNNCILKSISSGKNYLTFEIAKQFLFNFLNHEIKELQKNKKIKILALEKSLTHEYHFKNFSLPIQLKGKIDRIDEVDGVLRIVDYKTGKVESNNLIINDWEKLTSEESYSKSFQVLFYAYLYSKNKNLNFNTQNVESGIISFKNLRSGFMKVNNSPINQQTIDEFLIQLNNLFLEIYDKKIPFTEKVIIKNNF